MNLQQELEMLAEKIERNTAKLPDYQRYEFLLEKGGLSRSYIFSYLNRAGFSTWEELIEARKEKEFSDSIGGALVGAIIGLGIGLIIKALFGKD